MTNAVSISAPKQARAIATRKKLLDAAVDCLCNLGHAGTTTTVVAQHAGVSQGALYKHFGSKHQLLAATTAHLFETLIADFRAAFETSANTADPLTRAIAELWAVFLKPELYAVIDLYIAARTDEPLRLELVPVLERHRENLRQEARILFPEAAEQNPLFDIAVDSIMAAMQGAAISAAVLKTLPDAVAFAQFLERVCRRELMAPYGSVS